MTKKDPEKIYEKLSKLDYSIVHYKLKQEGYHKKKIKDIQKECLRFIALCATVKKPLAPSYDVDMCWHNMILCTKQYNEEVSTICGKFIHHNPNDGNKIRRDKDSEAFWVTIDEYEKVWGTPNLDVWDLSKKGKEEVNT